MALMKLATTWERFILKDLTKFGRLAKVSLITWRDKYWVEGSRNILEEKICLKGTVGVVLSDPSWKDRNARFTLVPLKPFYQ